MLNVVSFFIVSRFCECRFFLGFVDGWVAGWHEDLIWTRF